MLKLHDLAADFFYLFIFRLVSGDRLAITIGGIPPSFSYTVLVNQQCWRRISSPRHALLKQASFILGDGFRTLKRGF